MSTFGLSDGATFSHTCPECGSTVTIVAPEKNGHGSDEQAWARWRNLVRPQVMWPLLCPTCRGWWNERVNATERVRGSGLPFPTDACGDVMSGAFSEGMK